MSNTNNPEKTSETKPKQPRSAFRKVNNRDFKLNYRILQPIDQCITYPVARFNHSNISLQYFHPPFRVIYANIGSIIVVNDSPFGTLRYRVLPSGAIMRIIPNVPWIVKPNRLRRGNPM